MTPAAARPLSMTLPRRRHVQLFVNPLAGSWRRDRIAALQAAFEAAGAIVTTTPNLDRHAIVADGVDHVCAVGGDGTVRHVAAAVRRAAVPPSMSVYPLGTVNLLARECGYPSDPAAFVRRALVAPAPRRHHAALVGDTLMLSCASVGPDSRTVDLVSPRLKTLVGRGAYLVAFCRLLARWPRTRLRIVADGVAIGCEAVYVAKGRFFAGPWRLAPAAAVDEPLLHVVALGDAGRLAFLRVAWAVFRNREPVGVIRFACTALVIEGAAGEPVQADGDIVARLPVRIAIAAGTMAFC